MLHVRALLAQLRREVGGLLQVLCGGLLGHGLLQMLGGGLLRVLGVLRLSVSLSGCF